MGDMADFTLDQIDWDNEPLFPSALKYTGVKKHPMCKYCRKKKLRWRNVGGQWILFEKKGPHRCSKVPLSLDMLKKLAEEMTGKKLSK